MKQVFHGGQPKEHYSNIFRMEQLLLSHPQVSQVRRHKTHKAKDPSQFDNIGRCYKHHQSPHDLEVTIAASGATFYVGFTVNDVHQDLVALYWQHGKGMKNEAEQMKARAIFYDIAEAEHQTPQLSLHWSDAWAQTYKNPAVVGTGASSSSAGTSSSSAGPTPASGGNLASTRPLVLTDQAGAVVQRLPLSQVVPPPGWLGNSSSGSADSQRASGGNDGSRPLLVPPPPPPLEPPPTTPPPLRLQSTMACNFCGTTEALPDGEGTSSTTPTFKQCPPAPPRRSDPCDSCRQHD